LEIGSAGNTSLFVVSISTQIFSTESHIDSASMFTSVLVSASKSVSLSGLFSASSGATIGAEL